MKDAISGKTKKVINRNLLLRFAMYLIGTASLALGIVLNTKTGYGAAAINSVNYTIAILSGISMGNITILVSCLYMLAECIMTRKHFSIKTLLQLPYSLIFGRITDLFNDSIQLAPDNHLERIVILCIAIICMAIGVVLSVNMKLVPNPADGLVQEISFKMKKDFGFAKNLFDATCVMVTIAITLIFSGSIFGIGAGTIITAIVLGRLIALLNYLFKEKLLNAAGIQ